MSDYERSTVLTAREVFAKADEIFPERAELNRTEQSAHTVTYSGAEGTVLIDIHRHVFSSLVTVRTDRLRTSKLDIVARYFMNQLPYQPGDPPRA
ncbi:MAG TPA: hypothetical protein VFH27_02010 [Longimicrobiaceae bacterium]|nr:hypothetical protein [Longimicrobiaceae bacterium]